MVWVAAMCIGLTFGLATACSSGSASTPSGNTHTGVLVAAKAPAAGAQVVSVGLYGLNAYGIDPGANTFYASAYVWLRWKGDIDPVKTFEFANLTEERVKKQLMDEPMVLANGDKLMQLKIQGRFFVPYDLRNYPLDDQKLTIMLEDSANTNDKVVYQADTAGSGFDSSLIIPGWHLRGLSVRNLDHVYSTNFGDSATNASNYSAVEFSFDIRRVRNMFLWKLLLPVLLVLCTNWLALILPPRFADARMAMPATALLTTVFLQQSSLSAIPQVATLVLMDLIFVVAYVAIVFTFARVIVANVRFRQDSEPAAIARIRRVDHWLLGSQVVVVTAVLLQMILSRI